MTYETMDILKEFGIDPILLAAQVVNFLVLLFILKRFLYGPILKVLETRKKRIEESLKNAQEIEQKLAETEKAVEVMLSKVTDESQKIIDESKQVASQIIEESKKTAAEVVSRSYEDAKRVALFEKAKLEDEVKGNLSEIVVLALEKVLGKSATKSSNKEAIEKALKEI